MGKYLLIITFFVSSSFAQIINEICPSNTKVHEDFFAGFLDWIEIYNPTDETIIMTGYTMSDELSNPDKWTFPSMMLMSSGILTITASNNPALSQTINFAFPIRGGTVYMFSPDEELVDSLTYPALQTNHSYGQIDSHYYYFETPTPGDHNYEGTGFNLSLIHI